MKKLLSLVFCVTAASAFATTEVEVEIGDVGVTAINSGTSNTIVAVSYQAMEGGNIKIANLVQTGNLSVGDVLMTFNDGSYQSWSLDANKTWKGATYTYMKDSSTAGGDNPDATCSVGTGFWLIRQNASDPFYIYGSPATSSNVTTKAGNWNLVGNPLQSSFEITTTSVAGSNNVDVISVPNAKGKLDIYKIITINNVTRWRKPADTDTGSSADDFKFTIPAGTGFWIKTASAITINFK